MDFQKRWGKSTFAREKNGRDREKEKNQKKSKSGIEKRLEIQGSKWKCPFARGFCESEREKPAKKVGRGKNVKSQLQLEDQDKHGEEDRSW